MASEPTTQSFLELHDIREGVLILNNRDVRGVLMVSSLNFALKSDETQSAIVYAYQNFLNSLDFTCQIVVQSRNINITPYLDSLQRLEEQQANELLKLQTASYRQFIKELVKDDRIMTKNFYVVVPYALTQALGVGKTLKGSGKGKGKGKEGVAIPGISDEDFEKCRIQLWQRMEFVAMGLKRCGLEVMPLTTPELIELFWAAHHPAEAEVGYYPDILPELLR